MREISILLFAWWGTTSAVKWGYSSAGRAPALQAGGQGFEPP